MAKRSRGRPIVETLTPSQKRVLQALEEHIASNGMTPTFRELAEQLGQGAASISKAITRLERNGYVGRTAGKSRSLTVLRSASDSEPASLVPIPLLGSVPAGTPLFTPENQLGELLVESATIRSGKHFALKVSGTSMIDAGINSGDVVIVRQQPLAEHRDIVVALLNDEATVKRLHHRSGEIMLVPENKKLRPIEVGPEDDLRIVGKVVAVRGLAAVK
ncbi:transcriptional repressor LexA [Schlesneria paludicola]|uniref:transcriptional repressor LexA n=1 Tax=Schlesneria paludicola TaxID=360056 RepID=UPI00029A6A76|nr:transcriptional repressor LexA [Schlesneria paludicola]